MDLAVKNDISLEIMYAFWVGADPYGVFQGFQIGIQTETGLLVEFLHFMPVDRVRQLSSVVHASVPGNIALRARFKLGAKREDKWENDPLIPEELIHFLAGKIGWSRLR